MMTHDHGGGVVVAEYYIMRNYSAGEAGKREQVLKAARRGVLIGAVAYHAVAYGGKAYDKHDKSL